MTSELFGFKLLLGVVRDFSADIANWKMMVLENLSQNVKDLPFW